MADESRQPTPENMTMFQGFEWYVDGDHKHWARLAQQVPQLKRWGIDNVWVPPGCKASSPGSNGYDIYDLYDLGEFDQKGARATKWGSKDELLALCRAAQQHEIGIYWDAVLNHKFGADTREKCQAVEVDPNDRNRQVSDEYQIDAWVGYDFRGRGDKHSAQKYHWYHFSGVDFNADNGKQAIYRIMGDKSKGWAKSGDVDDEKGNYDYLMGCDLDYAHPEVEADVLAWGKWLNDEVPQLRGIRFDAIKHYSEEFLRKFVTQMNQCSCLDGLFFVGEFWKDSLGSMTGYLERMGRKFALFDVPLVYNFSEISRGNSADMRGVFDGTLTQAEPVNSVTLVMNHDTQPYQALEVPISDWFKPLAYALILLRNEGYPCVWYGDLYGIRGEHAAPPSCSGALPRLMLARKLYSYGRQADYFDYPTCLGWVRYGTWDRPAGCAVVLSNAGAGTKRMHVGEVHAGETWTDVLGWAPADRRDVVIGQDGFGDFACGQCSVSVWVRREAEGRERFKEEFDSNIYGTASN